MRLKSVPEDFFVRELMSLNVKGSGRFLYFLLRKRDLTTLEALKRLSRAWRVPLKRFGFAGLKDRRAVTEQFVSVQGLSKGSLRSLDDIDVSFVGFGDEPVRLGMHDGNFFRIVVREPPFVPSPIFRFRNLFGEQRFSGHNADVGRAIVKREWSDACALLQRLSLVDGCSSPLRSVRSVPLRLLKLFVHAYQSLLWNRAASRAEGGSLPVVGFGSDVDPLTQSVLDEEGVSPRDFIIREIPDISSEGAVRDVFVEVKGLRIEKKEDSVVLEFSLPPGSYATVLVRQLFAR